MQGGIACVIWRKNRTRSMALSEQHGDLDQPLFVSLRRPARAIRGARVHAVNVVADAKVICLSSSCIGGPVPDIGRRRSLHGAAPRGPGLLA